eukprot:COSAG01_NODE_452_length_16879_cov_474.367223_11_plen_73_part_00
MPSAIEGSERGVSDLCTAQNDDAARPDINEAFLLHGIPKQTLVKVLNNGLSDKFSGGQYVCLGPSYRVHAAL